MLYAFDKNLKFSKIENLDLINKEDYFIIYKKNEVFYIDVSDIKYYVKFIDTVFNANKVSEGNSNILISEINKVYKNIKTIVDIQNLNIKLLNSNYELKNKCLLYETIKEN